MLIISGETPGAYWPYDGVCSVRTVVPLRSAALNNMNYVYLLVSLLNIIQIAKCELSLEISKIIDGTEVPVNQLVEESVGANLSLTCKLVVSGEDDGSYHFGDELSWGRQRKNLQFGSVEDLQELAKRFPQLLHSFLGKSKLNEATLDFRLLDLADTGTYFCLSLKFQLFRIVKIRVNVAVELASFKNYFSAVGRSPLDFKFVKANGPLTFPRFLCTEDMFTCKSGTSCIDYQYVCDNVKDCLDGSDETYLCGLHPCADKKKCSNGRCISPEFCCDKFKDPDCDVNLRPPCCFENEDVKERGPSHGPPDINNLDFSNNFHTKYDLIPDYNDDDFNDDNDYNNNNPEVSSVRTETIWVVVPCTLILVLFIVCIALRQVKSSSRNRSIRNIANARQPSHVSGSTQTTSVSGSLASNSTRVSSHPSRSISRDFPPPDVSSQNLSRYLDLPPSYDEVVRGIPPSAPPCNGLA